MSDSLKLLAMMVTVCSLSVLIFVNGFVEVSGDGFYRALMAGRWAENPTLVSRDLGLFSKFWFPPYFWLTGGLFLATGKLVVSLKLVSYLAFLGGLLVLYRLGRELFNPNTALLGVALAGTLPFNQWLALSSAETTLYLVCTLAGFLNLVRWVRTRETRHVAWASAAFLLASMLRPEGWIVAVLFAAYVAMLVPGKGWRNRLGLLGWSVVPVLFIAFWLLDNWWYYGNPVYFMIAQRDHIGHAGDTGLLQLANSLQPFFFMLILSPVAFALAVIGAGRCWAVGTAEQRGYLLLALLYVGMLAALFATGLGTTAAPQRYGLVPLVLLIPFAAMLIVEQVRKPGAAKIMGLALAATCLSLHVFKALSFTHQFSDAVDAGNYLSKHVERGAADDAARLATEFELRYLSGHLPPMGRDFLTLASEHAAIVAHSGHPNHFATPPLRATSLGKPVPERVNPNIGEFVQERRFDVLLVRDRELARTLLPGYRLVRTFGLWSVLERRRPPEALGGSLGAESAAGAESREAMMPEPRIERAGLTGSIYPVRLELEWRLADAGPVHCDRGMLIKVDMQGAPQHSHTWRTWPLFCLYDREDVTAPDALEDVFNLDLPARLPGGRYRVSVAFDQDPGAGDAESPAPQADAWRNLGEAWLAHSKRQALVEQFRLEERDWPFLTRLLLSL